MKDFSFKIPQNIVFGMGSLNKLPQILEENKSSHVLLVSDRGLESIGVVKKVQDIIEAGGIKCTAFLDVVPNPTIDCVNAAAAMYKECGATSIVALGGGIALGNLVNESGAAAGMATLMGKLNLTGGFGTVLLFALFTVALAELTNSTVAAAVIVPIVISITTSLGLNPIPYWFIITLSYNAEFLLPVSVRAIPVSYGLSADIMLKKGIPMVVIRLAVALAFGYACMILWPDYGTLSNWTFVP